MLDITEQNVFFTSDTHFGHANIIKYSNRPFKSPGEMDEQLIKNWNDKIGEDDYVVHCGDVGLCSSEDLRKVLNRLNGRIVLVKGNHEKPALANSDRFETVKDVFTLKLASVSIFFSHYAHRVWDKSHRGRWHLYGHSHGTLKDDPTSQSFDIGVDCHDYKPLSFAEVRAIMSKKTWKPVDHHK